MENNRHYEQLVFSRSNYSDDSELFEVVSNQLKILLDAGYLAVVRYDAADPGLGIVVIEFEHDEYVDAWGVYNPFWINEEEMDMIICARENNAQDPNVKCGEIYG